MNGLKIPDRDAINVPLNWIYVCFSYNILYYVIKTQLLIFAKTYLIVSNS